MARAIKTTERDLLFDLNPGNLPSVVSSHTYIDLAQCYSLVNRIFVRQGNQFVIQSIEVGCQPGGRFDVSIARLSEDWSCLNAWEKGFRLWKEQQDRALEDASAESMRSRYHDFKIHMDTTHVTNTFALNLLPFGFQVGHPDAVYDWDASEVFTVDATTNQPDGPHLIKMVGDPNLPGTPSYFGLINAYAESRSRPADLEPNVVDANGGVFADMQPQDGMAPLLIDDAHAQGSEPPYLLGVDNTTFEFYPGGSSQPGNTPLDQLMMVDILSVNANQNYNSDATGGFVAPCGLLRLTYNADGVDADSPAEAGQMPMAFWMKIKLAPGEHKGILAQPMQEAN